MIKQNIGWAGEILNPADSEFSLKPNSKYGYDTRMDLYLKGVKIPLDGVNAFNTKLIGVKISTDNDGNIIIDSYEEGYVVDNDGNIKFAIPAVDASSGDVWFEEKKTDSVLYNIYIPDDNDTLNDTLTGEN